MQSCCEVLTLTNISDIVVWSLSNVTFLEKESDNGLPVLVAGYTLYLPERDIMISADTIRGLKQSLLTIW